MVTCVFESPKRGTVCHKCNYKLPRDYPSIPKRICTPVPSRSITPVKPSGMKCRHLGERFDDTITVKNCGCSTAESQLTVFECAIHGECLPTYRRGDLPEPIKTCRGCEDFRENSPPATTPVAD